MKKFLVTAVVLAFLSISVSSYAQDSTSNVAQRAGHSIKKGAKKAWKGTKKGAKVVGNKTAELATEGKAKVTDKEVEGYTAPNGRKVYVDDGDKYYWVNKKGGKEWITKDQMKQKQ
jgi:hypothetical protein